MANDKQLSLLDYEAGAEGNKNIAQRGLAAQNPESPGKRKSADHWSACGYIFYCDGKGYAVDKSGRTVCTGPEETARPTPQKPPEPQIPVPQLKRVGRPIISLSEDKKQIILGQDMPLREKAEKTGISKSSVLRLMKKGESGSVE